MKENKTIIIIIIIIIKTCLHGVIETAIYLLKIMDCVWFGNVGGNRIICTLILQYMRLIIAIRNSQLHDMNRP